jgi:hypothetical protein
LGEKMRWGQGNVSGNCDKNLVQWHDDSQILPLGVNSQDRERGWE